MSAKSNTSPEQNSLFEFEFDPREYASQVPFTPWNEYGDAKKVTMVMSPEKGAHVEIEERRRALISVLGHLARASKLAGLQNAIHTPKRLELQERYGKDLPDVINGAQNAERENIIGARNEFRTVYGYKQMVDHTHDPIKVSADFVDVYDGFQDIYHGSKGNKAREKLRNKLSQTKK